MHQIKNQKPFYPYLSPSFSTFFPSHPPNQLSATLRPLRPSAILGACTPHYPEVHRQTFPHSDFHPESPKLPLSVLSQTTAVAPIHAIVAKEQHPTQPTTTSTTTTPRSPISVTLVERCSPHRRQRFDELSAPNHDLRNLRQHQTTTTLTPSTFVTPIGSNAPVIDNGVANEPSTLNHDPATFHHSLPHHPHSPKEPSTLSSFIYDK